MRQFKKEFKLWFAWDSARIEEYLEEMSAQGWHVVQADGMLVGFLFERGEPKRVRYCMDYQRQERGEYRQIFADAGWTLLQKSMGWYIWSKEYETERPDIYTDVDSLITRNRNLLVTICAVFFTQMPMICINYGNLTLAVRSNPAIMAPLAIFLAAVYALLAYCTVKLSVSIGKLRRRKRAQSI